MLFVLFFFLRKVLDLLYLFAFLIIFLSMSSAKAFAIFCKLFGKGTYCEISLEQSVLVLIAEIHTLDRTEKYVMSCMH